MSQVSSDSDDASQDNDSDSDSDSNSLSTMDRKWADEQVIDVLKDILKLYEKYPEDDTLAEINHLIYEDGIPVFYISRSYISSDSDDAGQYRDLYTYSDSDSDSDLDSEKADKKKEEIFQVIRQLHRKSCSYSYILSGIINIINVPQAGPSKRPRLDNSLLASPPPDYYWREYTGIIPNDALPAGLDINNQSTYIGQARLNDVGILPGTIYRGHKEIVLTYKELHTVDKHIKILCTSSPGSFAWIPTTAETFHSEMIGKHPVIGGSESNYTLNIGRIGFQGETKTGKIHTNCENMTACMWIVHDKEFVRCDKFEVLVYKLDAPTLVPNLNYYWRDYTGEIPSDAIPAGKDDYGKPTYIGQAYLINVGIIPGIIYQDHQEMAIPYHSSHTVTKRIKILCSSNLKAIKWISASPTTVESKIRELHPVVGGFEHDLDLYIGRIPSVHHNVLTGKIVLPAGHLYYAYSGYQGDHTGGYEVMVYEP